VKKQLLKTGSYILLLTVLGLTVMTGLRSEPAGAQGNSPRGKLAGTWLADVTLPKCQSGQVIRTVQSLITFVPPATPDVRGGSALETSNATFFRSPGHGVWQHGGGPNFSTNFRVFVFNSSGVLTGTNDITKTMVLGPSDDEYTATTTFEIRDLNANLLQTGCGTDIAHRLE